ncbi:MAG: c-type cytochrome [Janthinobacterium lividum]
MFLLGFLSALVVLIAGVFLYLRFGHLPVATADSAFPMEAQIVQVPLHARIDRELQAAPFPVSEAVLQSGAHLYVAECASCHGTPGHPVRFAATMFPVTPQLWQKHGHGSVVGVSDDEAGETYWKVANGIRLSGMPAYKTLLSTEQMWQIALLMKNADQPLTPAVQTILQSTSQH